MTTFPLIRAAITPRRENLFDIALEQVEKFQAEGVLIKAEWESIKDTFTRAIDETWDKFKKEHYYTREERENEETSKLYWGLLSPYPHVLAGYLKKVQKAKNIQPEVLRDFPLAFFTEALPLNEMLVALKPLIGKRPPQRTAKQVERQGNERTCQICGRGILGHSGVIAHHGYERPGDGWQTKSCRGARELPFEMSREKLAEEIVWLKSIEADRLETLIGYKEETLPLYVTFQVRKDVNGRMRWVDQTVNGITRLTFDGLAAEHKSYFVSGGAYSYDSVKENCVYRAEQAYKHIKKQREFQEARYAGWKQIAIFDGERYWMLGQTVKTKNGDTAKIGNFYQHYPAEPGDITGGVRLDEMADGFVSWNVQELEAVG